MVAIQTAVLGMVSLQTAVLGMVAIQTAVLGIVCNTNSCTVNGCNTNSCTGNGCNTNSCTVNGYNTNSWVLLYLKNLAALQLAVLYLVIPYTSLAGTGCTIQLAVLYWVWLVVYLNFFSWDWLQYNQLYWVWLYILTSCTEFSCFICIVEYWLPNWIRNMLIF